MKPFVQLADPSTYVACSWDLAVDHAGRDYWVDFFIKHLETLLALGIAAETRQGSTLGEVQQRAENCRAEFAKRFRAFQADPTVSGRVTILTLDEWRDAILRRHGFVDPMIDLKNNENEKVIGLLPSVCHEVDSHTPADQLLTIIKGVFAGNLFDMGAKASAKMYRDGAGPSFFETRGNLVARPWLIDDFDAMAARFKSRRHKKAVYFIDNAGSDFLLGATPMIRWLAFFVFVVFEVDHRIDKPCLRRIASRHSSSVRIVTRPTNGRVGLKRAESFREFSATVLRALLNFTECRSLSCLRRNAEREQRFQMLDEEVDPVIPPRMIDGEIPRARDVG